MSHQSATPWWRTLGQSMLPFSLLVLVIWALFGTPLGMFLLRAWRQPGTATLTTSPIIVTQLRSLNRLETASQVSQQVVEARADHGRMPAFLGQDRLLMQVQTEMIAGIDLSRLMPNDVQVRGKAVTVCLPAPELFTVHIDDAHSRVYSRDRGWLVFTPDVNLESKARQQVLTEARATAQEHVLPTARINAESNVRRLLMTMGFATVEIQWGDQAS